jgi:hypothetical protein
MAFADTTAVLEGVRTVSTNFIILPAVASASWGLSVCNSAFPGLAIPYRSDFSSLARPFVRTMGRAITCTHRVCFQRTVRELAAAT